MKSERRHDLKTNTLARALDNLPETGRQYGTRILLVALAVVILVLLVRYRMAASGERVTRAAENLAVARNDLAELKAQRVIDPSDRGEKFNLVNARLDTVLSDAGGDAKLSAEALVARGDLNWTLANMPAATTQPVESEQSPDTLLKAAEDAYTQVIDRYPNQDFSVVTARFGLAAVAENRKEWDKVRKEYQAVIDDSHAAPVMQDLARGQLQQVDQLEKPVLVGEMAAMGAATPATQALPETNALPATNASTLPSVPAALQSLMNAGGVPPASMPSTLPSLNDLPRVAPATLPATTAPATAP